jgi:TPR repeat protein
MVELADRLRETGRSEEAEDWYRRAADAGYDVAMVKLADLLRELGRDDEADQWHRRAASIFEARKAAHEER